MVNGGADGVDMEWDGGVEAGDGRLGDGGAGGVGDRGSQSCKFWCEQSGEEKSVTGRGWGWGGYQSFVSTCFSCGSVCDAPCKQ